MGPEKPLPYHDSFEDSDSYVSSLLDFVSTSETLQTLCGGVHVLDIFTRSPGLYTTALPLQWREWFALRSIEDILELLLRDDLELLLLDTESKSPRKWRDGPFPPESLLNYIDSVRRHSLSRDHCQNKITAKDIAIPRNVTVGMKTKKVHEVSHFARYVSSLCDDIEKSRGEPVSHILDFGSGQNYLGRTLASNPYSRRIVAIESESHNVSGAKAKDIYAKVSHKNNNQRNKKLYRGRLECAKSEDLVDKNDKLPINEKSAVVEARNGHRNIDYISHKITSGNLDSVISQVDSQQVSNEFNPDKKSHMVISLHSCGNLLHHGLKTMELNRSVNAVALVGCCYNLMTEKLGPASCANETLRFRHPRLERESNARDEHGFPLSRRLELYQCSKKSSSFDDQHENVGIRLNITARMLAVQAPSNWSREDSKDSFKRHFFRALLQRLFLDHHVVGQIGGFETKENDRNGKPDSITSNVDETAWSKPLTIGKLPKKSYQSFPQYASDAIAKSLRIASRLSGSDPVAQSSSASSSLPSPMAPVVLQTANSVTTLRDRLESATKIPPETFEAYLQEYSPRKHEIEVLWSLMAFSAEVIEAVIVVDRWLYLCELEDVGPQRAWVETVWRYEVSPRNLVVVGVRK